MERNLEALGCRTQTGEKPEVIVVDGRVSRELLREIALGALHSGIAFLQGKVATSQRMVEQVARGEAICPRCQTVGESRGEEERVLQTRRGGVTIREIKCYCPQCRQNFFPSDANIRD